MIPFRKMPKESTRFSIVAYSLQDSLERLRDMPTTAKVRELRAKAESYERAVRTWTFRPPSEEQRASMVKLVLELNVEVMGLGRQAKVAT